MFGLGLQEMLVIAVLVIVFIPPDDLPALMRTAGRYYAKVRRASDDLRRAFNAEVAKVEAEERRVEVEKRRAEVSSRRPARAVEDEADVLLPDPRLPADAAPRRVGPAAPPPVVAPSPSAEPTAATPDPASPIEPPAPPEEAS